MALYLGWQKRNRPRADQTRRENTRMVTSLRVTRSQNYARKVAVGVDAQNIQKTAAGWSAGCVACVRACVHAWLLTCVFVHRVRTLPANKASIGCVNFNAGSHGNDYSPSSRTLCSRVSLRRYNTLRGTWNSSRSASLEFEGTVL